MRDFWTQVASPGWWLGVVIVGIIVSVIANFLTPRLDKILSAVSAHSRNKSELKSQLRTAQIELLRSNQHEQLMFAVRINYRLILSIWFILVGSLCLAVADYTLVPQHILVRLLEGLVGCTGSLIGLLATFSAFEMHSVFRESRRVQMEKSVEPSK